MYRMKFSATAIASLAFLLVVILFGMYFESRPSLGSYIPFVTVGLVIANLIAFLAMRLHQAESQSLTDPLTGAFNRRYLEQRLTQEIKRSERIRRQMSLLYINIDDFNSVNARLGRFAGDEALRAVAETASQCIRQMDIVARLGRDEFAVLLPETEIDSASSVAERIRELVGIIDLPNEEGFGRRLTLTVGVAVFRPDESAVGLLQRAEQAMRHGKLRGKNQTYLDPHDSKGSILLVEDDAAIRALGARALRKEGYLIDGVATGDTALDLLRSNFYNLLITDMQMEGVSGLEVLRALRLQQPEIPAISISGRLTEEDKNTLRGMGNVEFLCKPFQMTDLVDRVRITLSERQVSA